MANRAQDRGSANRRRLWWLVPGVLLGLVGIGAVGGAWVGSSEIEARLQRVARAAGLTLLHDGISVSPLGHASVHNLQLLRGDGSPVVRIAEISGALSPLDALAGRRRPESVHIAGLRLDVAVVDGQPTELLNLARAARRVLGGHGARQPQRPATGTKRGTAVSLTDGEIRIHVRGKGAALLPKGLKISGIQVDVDTAQGRGDVTAELSGSATAKLSARLLPAEGDKPARLSARFSPEFRLALPAIPGLPQLADALVIAGFGYDAVGGPRVEGLALRKGGATVVQIEAAGLADDVPGEGLGVSLGPVIIHLAHADLVAAMATPPTGSWPPAGSTWQARIGRITARLRDDGGLLLRAADAKADLPADMGFVSAKSVVVRASKRGGLAAVRSVQLTEPALDLRWRESGLKQVPGGRALYWAIERLRGNGAQPPDARAGQATAPGAKPGDPTKRAAKTAKSAKTARTAKERRAARRAARRERRRHKTKRKPATRAAIAPLRALHRRLLGTDAAVVTFFARLGRLAGTEVRVDGGRIGLLFPAAATPFAGLRDITLLLSRRGSDGSRALSATVEPFLDGEGWGPVKVAVQAAPGGHLGKATLQLAGAGWAGALSTLGKAASVQRDAHLSLDLTLTAKTKVAVSLTGTLKVSHVGINWWRIAPRPIDDFSFGGALRLTATANPPEIRLALTSLDLGGAKLDVTLAAKDLIKRPTVQLRIVAPEQDCGAIGKAIPASLIPTIGTITAEGKISGDFDLVIPLDNPYKGRLKANLNDDDCTVTQFGDLDVTTLARPFKRPVNESGTILEDQFIGPKSEAWIALAKLPPWVPYAMIATEDAAFYHHKGVRLGLTSRAIKMCLDYGRFVYGGSTITQQLVKNIFLTRDKYLGRKFEELLIVWHMERSLIDAETVKAAKDDETPIKDRILEIYINGIEFAPHLYGIQRGAKHYFNKDAADLTPLETAFLAANKPCPKCGEKRFVQKKWTPWWQARMVGIMNKMRTNGIISEEQFVAEAPYVPRFVGWPQTAERGPAGGVGGDEE